MRGDRCRRRSAAQARFGLTLVELMAATLLAALLMGAVLGLVTSITRQQRTILAGHGIPEGWQVRLQEVLEWDLQNSRSLKSVPRGFLLEGFASRDFVTGEPIHAPSRILYEIQEVEDRRHLVRREIHTESLNLENSSSAVVGLDVGEILCAAPQTSSVSGAEPVVSQALPDGMLPASVSVTLISSRTEQVLFSQTIQIR